MLLNELLTLRPSASMAAISAIAINVAMNAYSIAVAPLSHPINRFANFIIVRSIRDSYMAKPARCENKPTH